MNKRQILEQLGQRLCRLRKERQLTLEQLSQAAGTSRSFISQIERGEGNPSFLVLVKLGQALELEINDLFSDGDPSSAVIITQEERVKIRVPERGIFTERITPEGLFNFEALLGRYEPHSHEEEPFNHRGGETVWVIDGTLEFHFGKRVYTLNEGDTANFRGEIPHWARNPGDTITRVLMIIER